ncbi:MAG: chorismate mutase [Acidobacteriota bacterium]|nr:chorismate mutase [Acidobacteriota bacterium]
MSSETQDQAKKEMGEWRQRIDDIDLQLVKLFNERTQCAIEIGYIKKRIGLEIYSPSREAQVIANVTNANTGPLDAEAIRRLFERVIDEARRIERIHASQEEGGMMNDE